VVKIYAGRDAVEPGRELRVPPKTVQSPVDPYEGLLRELFRKLKIAGKAMQIVQDPLAVFRVDGLEAFGHLPLRRHALPLPRAEACFRVG